MDSIINDNHPPKIDIDKGIDVRITFSRMHAK
jgi:hypothetical protein